MHLSKRQQVVVSAVFHLRAAILFRFFSERGEKEKQRTNGKKEAWSFFQRFFSFAALGRGANYLCIPVHREILSNKL